MLSQALKDLSTKVLGVLNTAPASFLDCYPEGAVLVGLDGTVMENNEAGELLATLIFSGSHEPLNEFIKNTQNGAGASLSGVALNQDFNAAITAVPVKMVRQFCCW